MEKQVISQAQLMQILINVKGATFATVTMETPVTMNKKVNNLPNPYHGTVNKVSRTNFVINFDYENSVNNQLTKEGKESTFQAKPRVWGERVQGTCVVTHKGFIYVEMKPNGKPQEVHYLHNGQPIDKSIVEPYIPVKNSNNAEHQGVYKEILIRDVKLINIREIKIGGQSYIVK